ncbi:MAG: hypothetical protein QXE81_02350 [Desulfurococcaceae archaeon]
MLLKIHGNIIETDEKLYHVKEIFIGGRVYGSITISKSRGLHGYINLRDEHPISFESDEILIVGKIEKRDNNYKIRITEHRKNLVAYVCGNRYQPYEVSISLENLIVNILFTTNPLSMVIQYEPCNIEIIERPLQLHIRLKALE